jgi:hypothetical protein
MCLTAGPLLAPSQYLCVAKDVISDEESLVLAERNPILTAKTGGVLIPTI